jgi:NAD(P)-dependent dehydrogenase (short-subunit alcohol dehydrogenase family)
MGKNKIKPKTKKVAVIIGASGNLGQALVKKLRAAGYQIDPVWLTEKHLDATKEESFLKLPPVIHLAVYLAGVTHSHPVDEMPLTDWQRVINTNLTGAFLLAKHAFSGLKKGRGTFITISSINATHPYPNRIAYAASKSALEGLTRELAVEWGQYGISTHCLRLGHLSKLMKTTEFNPKMFPLIQKRIPSGRLIEPEDVASYIHWLAEGGARAVSGSVVDFDPAYMINAKPVL